MPTGHFASGSMFHVKTKQIDRSDSGINEDEEVVAIHSGYHPALNTMARAGDRLVNHNTGVRINCRIIELVYGSRERCVSQ